MLDVFDEGSCEVVRPRARGGRRVIVPAISVAALSPRRPGFGGRRVIPPATSVATLSPRPPGFKRFNPIPKRPQPIFKAFDAKKFKTFNCETCHGKDGVERKFKMPSNDIHPLPNTKEGFEAKLKAEPTWPKWTEFMAQKVEPAMGKLLDVPVFDPKKPVEGAFSCGKCHKLEATKP